MTRILPSPRIPQKRLIIPSGLSSHMPRNEALKNVKVESVMSSFERLKKNANWWVKVRPFFDQWPQYRYLDSGAFTYLKKYRGSRIKQSAKALVTGSGRVSRSGSARTAQYDKDFGTDIIELGREVKEHFSLYRAYLRENSDDWDFVCDLDVDTINFGETSGVEVTWAFRKRLREVAGDKLMPVWHPVAGLDSLKDLCREYEYIGIGSDMGPGTPEMRAVCNYAHSQGVKVHGFGTSKTDILEITPFDTVDSTTWLSSVRYGQFMGTRFSAKVTTHNDPRSMSRAMRFRKRIEDWGYDPEQLLAEGSGQVEKYEVALRLMQLRQEAAPPISAWRLD